MHEFEWNKLCLVYLWTTIVACWLVIAIEENAIDALLGYMFLDDVDYLVEIISSCIR